MRVSRRAASAGPVLCAARWLQCQWMVEKGLGPEWKPERAKFALVKTEGGRRLTALVDPGFPSAWRRSPFYENLKHWAAEAAQKLPDIYLVDVLVGQRSIVILPDRDVELGALEHDEALSVTYRNTATGVVFDVSKIKKSDLTARTKEIAHGPNRFTLPSTVIE